MWARPTASKQVFFLKENRVMGVQLNAVSGLHPARARMVFERAVFPDG